MLASEDFVASTGAPALAARSLEKRFGDVEILKGLTLEVQKGEALGIIGPSGSGKSTLLRCLMLLEDLTRGEIILGGHLVASGPEIEVDEDEYRRHLGLVFQEFNLWNNKSIIENVVEAPIYVLGIPRREALELGNEWLHRVGLEGHGKKYPPELSGGQRQRAALARAFIMNPDVMLLDEITSALDVSTAARLLRLIKELRTPDKTFIFVTHHLKFAEEHMDRLAVLVDGRIVESGPPASVIHNPQNAATRLFLDVVKESW